MSTVPKELIEEATKRGIVPGAIVISPYGTRFVVDPVSKWRTNGDGTGLANDDGWQIYSHDRKQWATVITPAAEGLKDGDATECGPAMRAAIIELAKELGVRVYVDGPNIEGYRYSNGLWGSTEMRTWKRRNGVALNIIAPEAFMGKMRVEASKPQPIIIDGDEVKFEKGWISVGCQIIGNDTVRAIAAKLIDQ